MDDWLLKYEKEMRDWRNLEYQKKLDERLERIRRVLDSGHPEYKKRHNYAHRIIQVQRVLIHPLSRELGKGVKCIGVYPQ